MHTIDIRNGEEIRESLRKILESPQVLITIILFLHISLPLSFPLPCHNETIYSHSILLVVLIRVYNLFHIRNIRNLIKPAYKTYMYSCVCMLGNVLYNVSYMIFSLYISIAEAASAVRDECGWPPGARVLPVAPRRPVSARFSRRLRTRVAAEQRREGVPRAARAVVCRGLRAHRPLLRALLLGGTQLGARAPHPRHRMRPGF